MFLITKKSNNQVIIGPRSTWHQKLIQSAIDEEFEDDGISITVPNTAPESGTSISEVIFYNVVDIGIVGEFNPKTQNTNGPFFNFPEGLGLVEQYWLPIDKPIDIVKTELSALVAASRWKLETSGTKITLQGLEITLDTNRGSRDIFTQSLLLGSTGTNWKFNEGWLVLSNADLQTIVNAITTHVQSAFEWENSKLTAITSAVSLDELNLIEVLHPSQVVVRQERKNGI